MNFEVTKILNANVEIIKKRNQIKCFAITYIGILSQILLAKITPIFR